MSHRAWGHSIAPRDFNSVWLIEILRTWFFEWPQNGPIFEMSGFTHFRLNFSWSSPELVALNPQEGSWGVSLAGRVLRWNDMATGQDFQPKLWMGSYHKNNKLGGPFVPSPSACYSLAVLRHAPARLPSSNIAGWWCVLTILKNDGVRQWEGWHPIYYGKLKNMFQTTNQIAMGNPPFVDEVTIKTSM